MDAKHVASLQTATHSRVPVAVGVHRGGTVVATPGGAVASDICLWYLFSVSGKQLTLSGHHGVVCALAFSPCAPPSSPLLLCSASRGTILLWDVEQCQQQQATGEACRGQELPSTDKGPASHISFSPDSKYIGVCADNNVLIFRTESCNLDTSLVGHSAPVTSAAFSPHHPHTTIITTSEDRTFKIWDLDQSSLLYQSPIISASPFLCIAVDPQRELMALGTADGKLRVYDVSVGGGYRCLHECNVEKEVERFSRRTAGGNEGSIKPCATTVIHSKAPWQQQEQTRLHGDHVTQDDSPSVEIGPAMVGLCYWYSDGDKKCDTDIPDVLRYSTVNHISEVLKEPPNLFVVTHLGLLRLNANTLEVVESLDFREPMVSVGEPHSRADHWIPAVASCDFVCNPIDGELYCAFGALFRDTVSVLSLRAKESTVAQEEEAKLPKADHIISVLSSAPLAANSPLRAEFTLKSKSATAATTVKKQAAAKGKPHQRETIVNQPLTFKSKVKSSGYIDAPRMKMFTPKTSTGKKTSTSTGSCKKSGESLRRQEYPVNCGPTVHLHYSTQLSDRPAAINSACFSGSGQYLACACSDKAAYVVKMPPSTGKTHTFVGHDGPLHSCCWSYNSQWLLTCSGDRSAKVWALCHSDPLLSLSTLLHNFKSETEHEALGKANSLFAKEVTNAQFYYLDKFVLLTSGNILYLYKYHIDSEKPDDIKRYRSNSRYKLVRMFTMESAQNIMALSCINDFHSYIVLVAGSNKALDVYDMNVGQVVRTIPDVHPRPVTCIAQNKGSRYVTHPPNTYDLFLTSAVSDGIKLWDLRTNRCVCRLSVHQNRFHPTSAVFSPCTHFIATGSEDKAAYIYDLRSSSLLHKLTGHSDVVSTVAYHPLKTMLSTCTVDGQLRFFSDTV